MVGKSVVSYSVSIYSSDEMDLKLLWTFVDMGGGGGVTCCPRRLHLNAPLIQVDNTLDNTKI